MNLADVTQTTSFRWTLGIAAALATQSCVIAFLIYIATVSQMRAEIDRGIVDNCAVLARLPLGDRLKEVGEQMERDVHRINLVGLFAQDGTALAGNIKALPDALSRAPGPVTVKLIRTQPYDPTPNESRAAACSTEQGNRLVVARDTDDFDALRSLVIRALLFALPPAIAVAAMLGVVLRRRGQTRFRLVRRAIDDVMAGNIKSRLPRGRSHDPFDRLSCAVNDMLDRLEEAIEDVSALGDDIAHAVRTPLTRARARLERDRKNGADAEARDSIAALAIKDIDQALAIVSAILRIRTIERAKRDTRFASVDVSKLMADATELYKPLADKKAIKVRVEAVTAAFIVADRDLLMEALCNLIDNAIKFTPHGGTICCRIASSGDCANTIEVIDTGPGISEEDRRNVLRRFNRGAAAQLAEGYGIGLSLVAAICKLHNFNLQITDASPGCHIFIEL